jgi:hypothetical protein
MASSTTPSTASLLARLQRPELPPLPRGRGRHAKLYVFNHRDIICDETRFNDSWNIVPFTVLGVQDAGFAKAPYSKNMPKNKLAAAKALAEVHGEELRLYSFEKMPMAKGDRVDDAYVHVGVGDVFTLFMDVNKFRQMMMVSDKTTHLLPTGGASVIPAFSLLEVEVAPKNHANATEKNTMVNVQTIRPVDVNTTLQSALTHMAQLPGSLAQAHARAVKKACDYPLMSRDLETNNVAFFTQNVSPNAILESVVVNDAEFVRLSGWSQDSEAVDFPVHDVKRAVNATDVDHALNLMSVAIAGNAFAFAAVHDPFWERGGGAQQRGVPFVIAHKLFASVPLSFPCEVGRWPDDGVFELDMDYDNGDGPQRVELAVGDMQDFEVDDAQTRPSAPDFPLVMPGVACTRGFTCSFGLRANKTAEAEPDVVRCVVNADVLLRAANGPAVVGQKRKLCSMQWA